MQPSPSAETSSPRVPSRRVSIHRPYRRLASAGVLRRVARAVPDEPESGPAGGGPDHGRAAARDRGRGLGQDARAHAPRRPPDLRGRREAERDPRDHVHEQGGGRDARPADEHARPGRAGDLDPHLPRRLRPHPAPRGGAARLPLELHDLRLRRPGAPREAVPGGAREGPEAVRPARRPRPDLERQEPAGHAGAVRGADRVVLRPDGRRGVRALPAQARGLERGRLRRHADADRADPGELPRRAEEVAEGVPLRPRRRVPGHEPRPVPAPAARWPRSTRTFVPWAIRTSPSTPSEAPTSATSSSSSATSRRRGRSRSSRTTAPRTRSSRPRTR